jgi:hypothetical protein
MAARRWADFKGRFVFEVHGAAKDMSETAKAVMQRNIVYLSYWLQRYRAAD